MNILIEAPFVNMPAVENESSFRYFQGSMSMDHPISDVLLDVRALNVGATTQTPAVPLVSDLTFSVCRGTTLILAGESGSGKTLTSRALTHLFPEGSPFWTKGEVRFEGRLIVPGPESAIRDLRRTAIRYVFQEPLAALNPVATVRDQMRCAAPSPEFPDSDLLQILTRVGVPAPQRVLRSYPHQLSAGLAQRVMFAMALLPVPRLIIADEPTASVDAPLKYQLLELLAEFKRECSLSVILLTHDLVLAREFGDDMILLLNGRMVEHSPVKVFFETPMHPYSQDLIAAVTGSSRRSLPREDAAVSDGRTFRGCVYARACALTREKCGREEPLLEIDGAGREVRCFYWK
jgi:oligopeptide/dipeptide ABC transporter ATP-binding protein